MRSDTVTKGKAVCSTERLWAATFTFSQESRILGPTV